MSANVLRCHMSSSCKLDKVQSVQLRFSRLNFIFLATFWLVVRYCNKECGSWARGGIFSIKYGERRRVIWSGQSVSRKLGIALCKTLSRVPNFSFPVFRAGMASHLDSHVMPFPPATSSKSEGAVPGFWSWAHPITSR